MYFKKNVNAQEKMKAFNDGLASMKRDRTFKYDLKRCFLLIASLFFSQASNIWAIDDLLVQYHYKGNLFSVHGQKVAPLTYVFNQGAKKQLKITTLDWPPYIGQDICKQGWVQQLTVALFASQDVEVTSTFYPWARTIKVAESGNADILYPEYFIEPGAPSDVFPNTKRVEHLALSDRFPGGPIAFMKRKGEKDRYQGDFINLKNEKIGVVKGYQNTPEFDELMDKGWFQIDYAVDDFTNVKKLVHGRVNLIIGDPSVIQYSVMSAKTLNSHQKKEITEHIEIVLPVIQYNHLYYAVSRKRPQWQNTLQMVNKTLAEFDSSGEMYRIIKNTNAVCGFKMQTLNPYMGK